MKATLLILVGSFFGGFAATLLPQSFAETKNGPLKVDSIEVRSITIKNPETERHIVLSASKSTAGIWLTGKDGRLIAICDVDNYASVGMYGNVAKSENGFNIAMAVDKDGPFMQVLDFKNHYKRLSLSSLPVKTETARVEFSN